MILGGRNHAGGKRRWRCRPGGVYCYSTTDIKPVAVRKQNGDTIRKAARAPVLRRVLEPVKRFIITAAQNATPVHEPFLKTLETACNHLNAELLVVPIRYKNPTSRWGASASNDDVWAQSVNPYLWNARRVMNENLVLLADIKTQPTAMQPLTSFDSVTGPRSAIIAHTKMHLKTVPTPQNRMAKILTTTGACTEPNYTDSKAGKIGEFHHTLGAVLVEIQGKKFHMRQLNGDKTTGEFTDLTAHYSRHKVSVAPRPLALVMGDTHVDFIDPAVERATFGQEGIVKMLSPTYLVWHDLLDGYSVNPHHLGNPFNAIAKWKAQRQSIRDEVHRAVGFVAKRTTGDMNSIIVPSNHDDFLRRWIIKHDWKEDPVNAKFYLETALAMADDADLGIGGTETLNPFAYWVDKMYPRLRGLDTGGARCLKADEGFALAGVEMGMHGDRGPNGAIGSIKNLRRIGVRSIIGHTHAPGIDEGCYQVGTSTRLKLEYTGGPSSWLNTHCVLYATGKRALINIIDGDWRLV